MWDFRTLLSRLLAIIILTQATSALASGSVLYRWAGGANGGIPVAGLISDSAGNFYGATISSHVGAGGTANWGTVFRLATDGTQSILYAFKKPVYGDHPSGLLLSDSLGNLYGTTEAGGFISACRDNKSSPGCGTVFMLSTSGKQTVLHEFQGGVDGSNPTGGLIADAKGNLFGTTTRGGTKNGEGTVFELMPNGTKTILHSFSGGSDGDGPLAGLIADSSGNLYGTTAAGGNALCTPLYFGPGCGIVFEVLAKGGEKIFHVFTGGNDGAGPVAGLLRDISGNLYGTTLAGGSTNDCGAGKFGIAGCGSIFKLAKDGTETVLHAFTGGITDGAYPASGLVEDSSGNLYGTTLAGGSAANCGFGSVGCGTVYKLAADGTVTILYVFKGTNGAYPVAGLLKGVGGTLFGTTISGGKGTCVAPKVALKGCGTLFKVKE